MHAQPGEVGQRSVGAGREALQQHLHQRQMIFHEGADLEGSLHRRGLGWGEAVFSVTKGSPEVPHRLRVVDQRLGECFLLALVELGHVEELAKSGLAHLVRLLEDVGSTQGLEGLQNGRNLFGKALTNQLLLYGSFQRAPLDFRCERENKRTDTANEGLDERETLTRLEQRTGEG